ncbi:MAG: MFS transporter [Candidatus Aenigmarchaeota archaeon]|nr:MFS transporter [Candidatus Aenigmarchaeota archaeon]
MKKENLQKFFIGALIATLATTAGYLIAPIEVRFLSTLTNNSILIGLTFAIGSLVFAFLSIWVGRLSDKLGREKFILIGLLLGIIYPLFYASTYNIFQYMGVRCIWAFSGVAIGPIFMAYLQDLLKDNKKKGYYFGILFSVQSISGSVGALLGGILSDSYNLAAPYYAISFIFLLATIISITQFKFKEKKDKSKMPEEKRDLLFSLRYMFKKPELVFYFFQNTGFGLGWGIKPFLWPIIIYELAGKDIITGCIFATMGIMAFFVLPFAGKFVDKNGPFHGAMIAMSILGCSGLVLAFSKDLSIIWIAAAIYAIGEAVNGPAQAILLTENIESKYRGEMLGLDAVLDRSIQTISPFIAGLFLTFLAPQEVLFFYITVYWITLLILIYIYNTKIKIKQK